MRQAFSSRSGLFRALTGSLLASALAVGASAVHAEAEAQQNVVRFSAGVTQEVTQDLLIITLQAFVFMMLTLVYIGQAHDAFVKWRTVPAPQRGQLIHRYGELLRQEMPLTPAEEAMLVDVITAYVDGATARHRMVFADGSHLETDMIVFSAGIRPRDELARQSLLAVGARGGIAIDSECRTNDHNIYAIGECAAWNDQTFGLVAPGYDMARVVAKHIAGDTSAVFAGADMSKVVAAHPQLLGIGLDESTAIIVQGHIAEVIGQLEKSDDASSRARLPSVMPRKRSSPSVVNASAARV